MDRHGDRETRSVHWPTRLLVSLSFCLLVLAASAANADVIVLANRTANPIRTQVKPLAGATIDATLPAGDVRPFFVDGKAHATFATGRDTKRYLLDANSAYYFGQAKDGRVDLQKIGLGEDDSTTSGRPLPGHAATAPPIVIPVKLLVDEEEPGRQPLWERRLRDRIAAASAVLDKYCRVQLKVVAIERWNSDDATTDFFDSLAEFEREVNPFPGKLAIGFTSQFQMTRGRIHMAGTRGTLHTHILVRDWARTMSEPERLELLVHELGHHLGASHSPEPQSVMRPVLGNREAVRANFQVQFDPVNTLVMAMIAEEMRRRKVQAVNTFSPGTRQRLSQIYGSLAPAMPDDSTAARLNQMVASRQAPPPLVTATRHIVATIGEVAKANQSLPTELDAKPGAKTRLEGDALTEQYVRRAAGIAQYLPEDIGPTAFVLGLGIALDNGSALRKHAKYGSFVQAVDPPHERAARGVFVRTPTIHGRADLAQQFVLSAYLTAVGGSQTAESVVIAHEFAGAKRPKGFSFADIAAGKAGMLFAGGVLNRQFTLADIAENFSFAAYMPNIEDLPEGLDEAQLAANYGDKNDPRFREQLRAIDERVVQLPPYRGTGVAFEQ